jgi:hypothetical protein
MGHLVNRDSEEQRHDHYDQFVQIETVKHINVATSGSRVIGCGVHISLKLETRNPLCYLILENPVLWAGSEMIWLCLQKQ